MTIAIDQNTAASLIRNMTVSREGGKAERYIVRIILAVIAIVPFLTFLFSFGNVGDLGVSLHIDKRIAYLTGPAVDLTATGMIVAATWLSYRGMSERELWRVHALSIICALIMFALNCGPAIYTHRYQLAGFSAVGPFLLMAMGFVGPWLLRQLTDVREPAAAVSGSGNRAAAVEAAMPVPAATETAATVPATGNRAAMPVAAKQGGNPKLRQKKTAAAGAAAPNWGDLALPLWEDYFDRHGEAPTAAVLASQLRAAYPNLKVPGSPRSERNIRAATEALAATRSGAAAKAGQDGAGN